MLTASGFLSFKYLLSSGSLKREETDHAEDEKEWEDDIQEEVLEVLEEVEADYQKRMESYKSQLNLWKMEKLRKVLKVIFWWEDLCSLSFFRTFRYSLIFVQLSAWLLLV